MTLFIHRNLYVLLEPLARNLRRALLMSVCLLSAGCSFPQTATIHVQDESGRPIVGATVSPQPEVRFYGPIVSNEHGDLTFGEVGVKGSNGLDYGVGADGFEPQRIAFPARNRRVTVTLRRAVANNTNESPGSRRALQQPTPQISPSAQQPQSE